MKNTFKAFSLIELLIAVSVLGILATVAVQNFSATKNRAYDTNLKSSVDGYKAALELYHAQYKSYFVEDHSSTCTTTVDSSGEYTLKGTGEGCTGFKGGSQGRITRKNSDELPNYASKSIAEVLTSEGFLKNIQTYPDVKDFDKNHLTDGREVDDYIMTLCDSEGYQASSKDKALNFAVYAELKSPGTGDPGNAQKQCGGPGTPGGWDVIAAQ